MTKHEHHEKHETSGKEKSFFDNLPVMVLMSALIISVVVIGSSLMLTGSLAENTKSLKEISASLNEFTDNFNGLAVPPSVPNTDDSALAGQPTVITDELIAQLLDDDPTLGSSDAKIIIVEFSDYQCPFCQKFWKATLPSLKSNYIDTGIASLTYRDFPLSSIHTNAQKAAEAAQCIFEQDEALYWNYHDLLFQNQSSLSIENYKKWAASLDGIDTAQFEDCLDTGKYEQEVVNDLSFGASAGIEGTPGFIMINLETKKVASLAGAYPFDDLTAPNDFKRVIEGLLE